MKVAMFAGEERSFQLRYPRNWPSVAVGCFESERFGNLAQLAHLSMLNLLGGGHVRHILAHALAGADNPLAMLKAHRLVEEEMRDKPLDLYIQIAVDVVADAFARRETDG